MSYIFTTGGLHTLTIRAGKFETGYTFQVTGTTIQQLRVVSPPNKLSYGVGEDFDGTGMELVGVHTDGTIESVTEYDVSGFDSSAPTECCTVTIGCGECMCTVDVEILPILYLYGETDDGISLIRYYGRDQYVTVPSHINNVAVTKIEATCFMDSKIIEVTIPDTVTEIG